MDALLARQPSARRELVGNGAARVTTVNGRSLIHLDDRGVQIALDFDVAEVATVPAVSAGDLVLLRGDILHRTQDASTQRVAVSFRMINSRSMVSKRRMLEGSQLKRRMMLRNPFTYVKALRCFNECKRDEVSVGELLAHMRDDRSRPCATAVAMAELTFKWRGIRSR